MECPSSTLGRITIGVKKARVDALKLPYFAEALFVYEKNISLSGTEMGIDS